MAKNTPKKALSVARGELEASERYLLLVISVQATRAWLRTTRSMLRDATGLSPNTITRALGKLEKLRLISRERESLGQMGSFMLLRLDLADHGRPTVRPVERPRAEVPTTRMTTPRKLLPRKRRRLKPDPGPLLPLGDLPEMRRPSRIPTHP